MKKPGWISFCGWAVIVCVSLGFGLPLVQYMAGSKPTNAAVYALIFLPAIPCFVLWALGSIVSAMTRYRAKAGAQAMAAAFGGAGLGPGLLRPNAGVTSAGEDTRATAVCGVCGQEAAVLRCTKHDRVLCATCLRDHHQPEVCFYQSLALAAESRSAQGGTGPRRVSSPLDLTGTAR